MNPEIFYAKASVWFRSPKQYPVIRLDGRKEVTKTILAWSVFELDTSVIRVGKDMACDSLVDGV
jgi:hypothetical protein